MKKAQLGVFLAAGAISLLTGCVNVGEIQKEAERGNTESMRTLSQLYPHKQKPLFFTGDIKDVPLDMEKSLSWLKKSAENGNQTAMIELAMRYHNQKVFGEAAKWFIKTIDTDSKKKETDCRANEIAAWIKDHKLYDGVEYLALYVKLSQNCVPYSYRIQNSSQRIQVNHNDTFLKNAQWVAREQKEKILADDRLTSKEKYTQIKALNFGDYEFRDEVFSIYWKEFVEKNYTFPGNKIPIGSTNITTGMPYYSYFKGWDEYGRRDNGKWRIMPLYENKAYQKYYYDLLDGKEKVAEYTLPSSTKFQKPGTKELLGLDGIYGKELRVELDKGTAFKCYFADITDKTDELFVLGMTKDFNGVSTEEVIATLNKTYPNLTREEFKPVSERKIILGTAYKAEYNMTKGVTLKNDKVLIIIKYGKKVKLSDIKVTRIPENDKAFRYAVQQANSLLNPDNYAKQAKAVELFIRREIQTDSLVQQLQESGKVTSTPTKRTSALYTHYENALSATGFPLIDDHSNVKGATGAMLGYMNTMLSVASGWNSDLTVFILDKKLFEMGQERYKVIQQEQERVKAEQKQKEKARKLSI